jgi:hypothetical protein
MPVIVAEAFVKTTLVVSGLKVPRLYQAELAPFRVIVVVVASAFTIAPCSILIEFIVTDIGKVG